MTDGPQEGESHPGTTAHDFGGYRLNVKGGDTGRLIVSLAGIGVPSGDRPGKPSMALEWNGTFERLALRDHLIFVRDLDRSWFNNEDGWNDLVAFIADYCAAHRIAERIGIGLSMGGSGLLILDRDLGFDRSIVMGPQVLLGNHACPWDRRFDDLWAKVGTFRHADLGAAMRGDADMHVVCPIDVVEDVLHVRRLMRGESGIRVSFVHGDHNIGVEMRRRSSLDDYVRAVVERDDGGLRSLGVFDADRRVFDLVDAWRTGGPTPRVLAALAEIHRDSPDNVPEFMAGLLGAGPDRPLDSDGSPHPVHAAQVIPPLAFPRLAAYGWFGLEDERFMWSKGAYHLLRLDIVDFDSFPATKLLLTLVPLVNEAHRRQTLAVGVDGETVLEMMFSQDARGPVEICVPIRHRAPEILLTTPLCVSPLALGLSGDSRMLAFQLTGARLLPS